MHDVGFCERLDNQTINTRTNNAHDQTPRPTTYTAHPPPPPKNRKLIQSNHNQQTSKQQRVLQRDTHCKSTRHGGEELTFKDFSCWFVQRCEWFHACGIRSVAHVGMPGTELEHSRKYGHIATEVEGHRGRVERASPYLMRVGQERVAGLDHGL